MFVRVRACVRALSINEHTSERKKGAKFTHFPPAAVLLAPCYDPSRPGLLSCLSSWRGKCVSNQQVKTHRRGAVLLIMAEIKLFAADEQIKTWELIPITAALKHAGGRMKFIFVLAVRVHGTRIDLQHMCFLCAFT